MEPITQAPIAPPPAEQQQQAKPNEKVSTGHSHMAIVGAKLAANFTIILQENEIEYPHTIHYLIAANVMTMFYNIAFELCLSLNRELGLPDLTVNAQLTQLRDIAKSVAYDALTAAYGVLYNKARRLDHNAVRQLHIPDITHLTFPIYLSAIINALGPIQQDDLPSRRVHIPILSWTSVTEQRPDNYASYRTARFREKYTKTRMLSAAVESLGVASSSFWTLWCTTTGDSRVPDTAQADSTFPMLRLWSPVKYDDVEHYLKLAVIYARAPLAIPGICAHSITRWYETDELARFVVTPTLDSFPLETRNYPVFWKSCSAWYGKVESQDFNVEYVDDPDAMQITASSSNAPPPPPASKKRKLRAIQTPRSPTYTPRSPTYGTANAQTVTQYRIVYYYFDHIAADSIGPHEYNAWIYELNQAN